MLGSSSPRIGAVMMRGELVRNQLVGITQHFLLSGSGGRKAKFPSIYFLILE